MVAKKKGAGGKLSRSEVVTVRFDPKLRFAAELAARKQRRTLSSFIEWAAEEAVSKVAVSGDTNVNGVVNDVWDVDEADRFINLANKYPELLSFDEERLLKLIQEYEERWRRENQDNSANRNFIMDALRRNWETLNEIITGKAKRSDLEYMPF